MMKIITAIVAMMSLAAYANDTAKMQSASEFLTAKEFGAAEEFAGNLVAVAVAGPTGKTASVLFTKATGADAKPVCTIKIDGSKTFTSVANSDLRLACFEAVEKVRSLLGVKPKTF